MNGMPRRENGPSTSWSSTLGMLLSRSLARGIDADTIEVHGLIADTTGSGKSELLQTIVLTLARQSIMVDFWTGAYQAIDD